MINQDKLFEVLKDMVDWTFQIQKQNKKAIYGKKNYLKELCSIKFSLPRQSGHTTMAQKLFSYYLLNPIYISPFLLPTRDNTSWREVPEKDFRVNNFI